MKTPGMLVSPAWLSGHLKHPGRARSWTSGGRPRAASPPPRRDVRGRPHPRRRVPRRRPRPLRDALRGRAGTASAARPARSSRRRSRRCGIDDEMFVVAYDDQRGSLAARLWWMLWVTGHQASLLDGGLEAWSARAASSNGGRRAARAAAVSRRSRGRPTGSSTAGAVESTVRSGTAPVLDARAGERYRGETEPHRSGRRPHPRRPFGAVDRQPGCRRARSWPPTCSRERYEALGVTNDAAIVLLRLGRDRLPRPVRAAARGLRRRAPVRGLVVGLGARSGPPGGHRARLRLGP